MPNNGGQTLPRIERAEHIGPDDTGDNIEAKRVAVYEYTAGGAWKRAGLSLTERYDVQGNTIYVGAAIVGTADASTGWEIIKYDLANLADASGMVATDVSWDDRTTGSYA